MRRFFYLFIITVLFAACQSGKPVKKVLLAGLTTTGNKIACGNVFISVNGRRVENNEFTYGERFYVNFDDIRGFSKKKKKVLPGMEVAIINSSGDTIMKNQDLYSQITDGFESNPFQLAADLTAASPMQSNNDYSLYIRIWDKKGSGSFSTKFDFKVKPNNQIKTELINLTYNEIYLYSQKQGKVIRDGKIKFDDNNYLILEGLKGFKVFNNKVYPGLSLTIKDSVNTVITQFDDLFAEYSADGLEEADVFMRASAKFKIEEIDIKNPLNCEMVIWDKKSPANIQVKTKFTIDK